MSSDLKLNPYAELAVNHEKAECVLIAPKPGEGILALTVKRSEQPSLYELLDELSQVGLDQLDVERDLDNDGRDLLSRFGVLVTPENTPEKPLYSCLLDDIEPGSFSGTNSLLVNPTFRFEPFDLSNFRSLLNDKHFSPYLATAWIKSPGIELDLGYWINNEHASIVSGLRAGGAVPDGIDPLLSAKLTAAGILIEPGPYSETEEKATHKIEEAKRLFSEHKYAALQNVIPDSHIRSLQKFYNAYVGQGFMSFGDTQVKNRYKEGNEALARFLHLSLAPLMSKLVGREVKPSYCYAASYREGAELAPHVDREACEYSFSLQIDYEPASQDNISPWPLYISTRVFNGEHDNKNSLEWSDFEFDPETERPIHLGNGDCLAYRGCELAHYRRSLPRGHKSTSIFFHYVPLEFDGVLI